MNFTETVVLHVVLASGAIVLILKNWKQVVRNGEGLVVAMTRLVVVSILSWKTIQAAIRLKPSGLDTVLRKFLEELHKK